MGPEHVIGGRYRLLDRLDARAWRACDELLQRDVVVAEVAATAELRSAARLDSPHATRVFDVLSEDGRSYAVTERVDGPSLADLVRDGGPLPAGRVAQVGLALLAALDSARALGLGPRLVTPDAVQVRRDGTAVLAHIRLATTSAEGELRSVGSTLLTAAEGAAPADDRVRHAGPLTPVLTGLLAAQPTDGAAARRGLLEILGTGTAMTAPTTPTAALPLPVPPAARQVDQPPASRPPRSRRPALLAAAVLLVAAAGAAGWLASTRGPARGGAAQAQGSPRPSAAAAVPPSWHTYEGPGYRVRYPAGWQLGTFRGQTQLRDPATHRTVRIAPASLGGDPLATLRGIASSFAASYPSYAPVRLEQTAGGAAVWEMTYTDGGAQLHAADYAVVLGGRGFTLFTQSRAADWAASQADLRRVVSSLTAV